MTYRKRFPLLGLVALLGLLALWLLPGAPRAKAADDQWRARYFNSRTPSGGHVWERMEDAIDHDWGGGSPNAPLVNSDNFSARWDRTVNFPAGNYRFFATMDDGMRVWIDDVMLIDNWTDSQVHTVVADRFLNGGDHRIRVEYYEAGGMAVAKFSWQQIGGGQTPGVFGGWRGEYFNNMSLTGAPATVRDDANINFDWGNGSPAPGVGNDRFSVRWTRTLNFNPGTYRFDVFSDDGIRVWVNNALIIDQWRDQSDGRFSANVNLSGSTTIRVEYYENVGRAAVSLSWTPGAMTVPPPGTGGPIVGTGTWIGEYFNNRHLSGTPARTRNDAVINFDWGDGSPIQGVGNDNFSVRWSRTEFFPAGTYRFDVFSDDGVRLWVNNQLVIDEWRDQENGRFSAHVTLSGTVPLRLEYYDRNGRAAVSLSWTPPTDGATAPPTSSVGTATVANTRGSRLNIRATPNGVLVGQLQPNQTVGLTGFRSADSGWVEIFRPTGGTGWVSTTYVNTSIPVANLTAR